jgi:hypothetical protein
VTIDTVMILAAALVYAVRLNKVRALWRLPLKNGEGWFLAQAVPPDFYRGTGADLLRRYHRSLFLPFAIDAPVTVWLAASGRYVLLACAQWLAIVMTLILDNVLVAHFSYRATALCDPPEAPSATAVHLSLAPRRLRDHTRRWVEVLIGGALAVAVALLARAWVLAPGSAHLTGVFRSGMAFTAWVLYLELGLVLLKIVFVRWRLPLPANRTEDFRRWRSAWLDFHLKFLDALRLVFALIPPSTLLVLSFRWASARPFALSVLAFWVLALVAFTLFMARERRRLVGVEREVRPIELVKEFPRRPVPKGRFLAGGLLYFDRDNPGVLVRGHRGIALNLAHPSTYAWAAYLIGLVVVMTWMVQATGAGVPRLGETLRRSGGRPPMSAPSAAVLPNGKTSIQLN